MKTAYYTFTTWGDSAMAAGSEGGARQAVLVRQPDGRARAAGGGNVIDLDAWRAAELCTSQEGADQWDEAGWDDEEQEEPELVLPAPRQRRSRRDRAMFAAELVSTLSVVAAALAIVIRVLTF